MTEPLIVRPQSAPTETQGGELSLQALVEPIFRHLRMFLMVVAAVLLLAAFWIFGTARKYESEGSLLVQNARSNAVITAGNSGGPTVMRDVTEEELNSEIEVLTSNDLLDEVVSPGWAAAGTKGRSPEEIASHESAVDSLSRRLDASVARKSHVLVAKITAPSPTQAQEELQGLFAAFMARQRQIGRPPGATRFFAQQAERYRTELTAAQASLAELQERQKFVNVSEREAALATKLATADGLRREADVQIGDLEQRMQAELVMLHGMPARQPTQERTAPLSGALDTLTTQLVTLKNQRAELLNKFQPHDRMVAQVEAQIAETEAGIRAAGAATSKDTATDINPTWQQMQTDVTMLRAQIDGQRARRGILSAQIAETQSSLNQVEGISPEFSALQLKVTELENNYQTYLQKRDEGEIADAMDRQDLLNFAVVQSPTLSTSPVHPQPKRDSFLGLITALLLGGIAVFLMESVRDTAGTAAELERWSPYPTLATVPRARRPTMPAVPTDEGSVAKTQGSFPTDAAASAGRLAYLRSSDLGGQS